MVLIVFHFIFLFFLLSTVQVVHIRILYGKLVEALNLAMIDFLAITLTLVIALQLNFQHDSRHSLVFFSIFYCSWLKNVFNATWTRSLSFLRAKIRFVHRSSMDSTYLLINDTEFPIGNPTKRWESVPIYS